MKVLAFFLAVFGMVLFSSAAYAEDMSIDMLNKRADGEKMVYSVDVANIKRTQRTFYRWSRRLGTAKEK